MPKHAKLTKIVIQTYKHEIAADCKLYAPQFGILGWKIEKGSWFDGYEDEYENSQITLTRLKKPNASLPNKPPALSEANGNKPNHHQLADNAVFDLD